MKAETTLTPSKPKTQSIPSYSPKKFIWISSLAHCTNDFYNGFLGPLLPILVLRLDISLALAGTLVSIFSVFNSLLHPFFGMIADRLRRNYFFVFGPLIAGVFMSLIGLANSYLSLVIILALSGIGTSIFHPQAATLVGKVAKLNPGKSMSIFGLGGTLGVALGALVIIPLVMTWGLQSSLITVLPAIAIVFVTFRLLDSNRGEIHQHERINPLRNLDGYWPVILILFFMAVIRSTFIICFQNFMPLLLAESGESLFSGALSVAILQISGGAGLLVGGYLSDKFPAKKVMQSSFLFALPFGILFFFFPTIYGIVFIGLAGFFVLMSLPINILIAQKILPKNVGFASGIMMGFAWGTAGLLATPVGVLADIIGLKYALLIVTLLMLPGFILARSFPIKVEIR